MQSSREVDKIVAVNIYKNGQVTAISSPKAIFITLSVNIVKNYWIKCGLIVVEGASGKEPFSIKDAAVATEMSDEIFHLGSVRTLMCISLFLNFDDDNNF